MDYIISFLEGIITFISPCLLPMLPIYVSYFAGGESDLKKTVLGSLGFVSGFTVVFVALGAFAGSVGGILIKYKTYVNILSGALIIFFGLNYLGVFDFNIFRGGISAGRKNAGGFFSAAVLGMVFSVGWTPCVGVFLSSALILASRKASTVKGMLMLLSYSLGLGVPFVMSAVLIDRLKDAFEVIKKNYKTVNMVSGILLILIGIFVMTGGMGRLVSLLA